MEMTEVAARVGVQNTLTQYIRFVDTGKADRLAGLFLEECVYQLAPDSMARRRDEIVPKVERLKDVFATAPDYGRIRHHITPAVVEFPEPGRAKAFGYFCAFAAVGPDHWGSYRDELVERDGQWLFASRLITLEGAVSDSPVKALVPVSDQ